MARIPPPKKAQMRKKKRKDAFEAHLDSLDRAWQHSKPSYYRGRQRMSKI